MQQLILRGVQNYENGRILKKRDGKSLSKEEIEFFIKGYTNGDIPDYQASSLAMAIFFPRYE